VGPWRFRVASPIRLAGVRPAGGFGRLEAGSQRRDVADWTMPVSDLDVIGFRVGGCGRIFWRRTAPERWGRAVIASLLEVKGAVAGIITATCVLVATFIAGGMYRNHIEREEAGDKPLAAANLAAKGRSFFFQSCAHCHGQDADGGEDAPSLLKLQISGAHMALVIQNGIKDEMPSFAKKYNEQEIAAIVAYLKTLH
jgi:mono/diheme cytochrome c family protein